MCRQLTPLVVMLVVNQQTEAANARATQNAKMDAKRTRFNVCNDIITVRGRLGAAGATVVLTHTIALPHQGPVLGGVPWLAVFIFSLLLPLKLDGSSMSYWAVSEPHVYQPSQTANASEMNQLITALHNTQHNTQHRCSHPSSLRPL